MAEESLVCHGLAAIFEKSARVETHCACGPAELSSRAREVQPHAVVLWVEHADERTVNNVVQLRTHTGTPACIVARTIDADAFRRAFLSRPDGLAVVLRREQLAAVDLFRTILLLINGRIVLSPIVLEQLVRDSRAAASGPLDELTPCEKDVLGMVAMGLRNSAIATRLGRSKKLVEKHIGRTFVKLGLSCADPNVDRRVMATRIYLQATSDGG